MGKIMKECPVCMGKEIATVGMEYLGKKRMRKCSASMGRIMNECPVCMGKEIATVGMEWSAGMEYSEKERMKKCSQYPRSESHNNYTLQELDIHIQSKILACLQIEDLFGSCLLVCKQWKDEILLSESFARLHHRHSSWVYLESAFDVPFYTNEGLVFQNVPFYPNKGLVFQNGPYKVLKARLEVGEEIMCSDKGIVCTMGEIKENPWNVEIRVGNPLKDKWKIIPSTSNCIPYAMRVDTSTSPAAFKIVACCFRMPDLLTEIFDSRINTWIKGNTICLNGPFQDKLGQALVLYCPSAKKIVGYDFEQDIWSVKSYSSPEEKTRSDRIMLCKEELILVSNLWPHAMLWKEKSCCKGIIQWGLIAKLDLKEFLAQHKLETGCQRLQWNQHCTGDVIIIMIDLPSKKTAVATYDMRKGCWELGGLMEGTCAPIKMNFTPSLITV